MYKRKEAASSYKAVTKPPGAVLPQPQMAGLRTTWYSSPEAVGDHGEEGGVVGRSLHHPALVHTHP